MDSDRGDLHSHLVPGVDDGARTVGEALRAVGRMWDAGIRRIVVTPHVRASWTWRSEGAERLERIARRWRDVRREVAREFPRLDFRRGAEVRLDARDADLSDPALHLGGTAFVLVEWARFRAPERAAGSAAIERLVRRGSVPVIAHPERYAGVDPEMRAVRDWKRAGAFLQGSYGSLAGRYGPRARERLLAMLEAGLVDYFSTDFHGRPNERLHVARAAREMERRGGDVQMRLLSAVNPGRLFRDLRPRPVAPLIRSEVGAGA